MKAPVGYNILVSSVVWKVCKGGKGWSDCCDAWGLPGATGRRGGGGENWWGVGGRRRRRSRRSRGRRSRDVRGGGGGGGELLQLYSGGIASSSPSYPLAPSPSQHQQLFFFRITQGRHSLTWSYIYLWIPCSNMWHADLVGGWLGGTNRLQPTRLVGHRERILLIIFLFLFRCNSTSLTSVTKYIPFCPWEILRN